MEHIHQGDKECATERDITSFIRDDGGTDGHRAGLVNFHGYDGT